MTCNPLILWAFRCGFLAYSQIHASSTSVPLSRQTLNANIGLEVTSDAPSNRTRSHVLGSRFHRSHSRKGAPLAMINTLTIHELAALLALCFLWWSVRAPRRPFRDLRTPGDWKR
jgi:hypothetical protein